MLENNTRIAVVVAHPDDEVLGAGGTIAKLVEANNEVDIIVVTDGASAQYSSEARLNQRRDEFNRCCQILGVSNTFNLAFPDMRLDTVEHLEINRKLGPVLQGGKYDCVLTHFESDVNLDHTAVARSVQVCTRPTPGCQVKTVAAFAVASSTEWGLGRGSFFPNWFQDISSTLDRKIEAFAAYEGERRDFPHPRSSEAIRATAQYWGSNCGVDAAEPFMLLRRLES